MSPKRKPPTTVRLPAQMLREHMEIHSSALPAASEEDLKEFAYAECQLYIEAVQAEEAEKVAALTAVARFVALCCSGGEQLTQWSLEEQGGR